MPTDTKDLLAQVHAFPMTLAEAGFGTAAGLMGATAASFAAAADAVRVTVHAPFENFLKIWNYIPVTIWWKTFAPEFFTMLGKPADIISQGMPPGLLQNLCRLPVDISGNLAKGSGSMGEELLKFTKLSLSLASSPKLPESSPNVFAQLVR